jgi:hypothetical protein
MVHHFQHIPPRQFDARACSSAAVQECEPNRNLYTCMVLQANMVQLQSQLES